MSSLFKITKLQQQKLFRLITIPTIALLFGIASAQAQDSNAFKNIALTYTINLVSSKLGNATVGQLETTLTQEQGQYSVHSRTRAQGLAAILIGSDLQQNCTFDIQDGRVVSNDYSGGRKTSDDYQVSFDWNNRKINFTDGESLDMPQGYLIDLCNMSFAAALLKEDGLANDTLYVLDGKKKRILGYKLKESAKELIETPVGSFDTIKIVLEREFKPERTFSLWLSLNHDYVPIKMEDKRSSRTLTILANAIEN